MGDFSWLNDAGVKGLVTCARLLVTTAQEVLTALGERQNGERSHGLALAFRVHGHHHGALLEKLLRKEPSVILAPGRAVPAVLNGDEIGYRQRAEASDFAQSHTLRSAQSLVFAQPTSPVAESLRSIRAELGAFRWVLPGPLCCFHQP